VNWAAVTAIGTVLAGLALPLAFIQLGALRQDRLRAQINKIGVWAEEDDRPRDGPERWVILFIQNASELPVEVHYAELAIATLGYKNVRGSAAGEPPQTYADKRTGPATPAYFVPGTIPPGHKWHDEYKYSPDGDFDWIEMIRIRIIQLAITALQDASGKCTPTAAGSPGASTCGANGPGASRLGMGVALP
jgi:hypothetical protein